MHEGHSYFSTQVLRENKLLLRFAGTHTLVLLDMCISLCWREVEGVEEAGKFLRRLACHLQHYIARKIKPSGSQKRPEPLHVGQRRWRDACIPNFPAGFSLEERLHLRSS